MDSGEGRGMPQLDINCNDWGCSLFYYLFPVFTLTKKGSQEQWSSGFQTAWVEIENERGRL